jgi:N-acetylmuramoyl-L-alanine amidase
VIQFITQIFNFLLKKKKMERNFLIIWGVAHSDNVAGKPDGRHHEPVWSKEQCTKLDELCRLNGIDSVIIQPKNDELAGRMDFVDRCNVAAKPYKKALLISIHNNAAGMGVEWMEAHGWLIYTCRGWTQSDVFAEDLFYRLKANFPDLPSRQVSKEHPCFEENWTVLMGMYYNAVLIEWMFQDNKDDLALIENDDINSGLRLCLFNFIKTLSEKKW